MLEYYSGVQVRPLEFETAAPCDLLLVGLDRDRIDTASSHNWHILWEGIRPQELSKDHFTLYHLSTRPGPHPQPLSSDMIRLK